MEKWNAFVIECSAENASRKAAQIEALQISNERRIPDFVYLTHTPQPNSQIFGKLTLLVAVLADDDEALRVRSQLLDLALTLGEFWDRTRQEIGQILVARPPGDQTAAGHTDTDNSASHSRRALLSSLISVFDYGEHQERSLSRAFFLSRNAKDVARVGAKSHYIMYRYSTQIPEIVRTYLSIKPELMDDERIVFQFQNEYLSPRTTIKRRARGALIPIRDAINFIGLDFEFSSPQDHEDFVGGVNIISTSMEEITVDNYFIPAIQISSSLTWRPIISRCALVHTGITHDDAESEKVCRASSAGILRLGAKEDDEAELINSDLVRIFQSAGRAMPEQGFLPLASRIRMAINGRPHWDRDRADLGSAGVRRAVGPEDGGLPRR